MSVPYMGSKRGIAKEIVDFMMSRHSEATHLYDLFGGGGAISFEAYSRGMNVVYNDKDKAISSLIHHLLTDGDLGEWPTRWVNREEFHELKLREDWVGGFVRSVWSFGNNPKKGYLYGKNIAEYKRLIHDAICHPHLVEANEVHGVPMSVMEGLIDINERRLAYTSSWRKKTAKWDVEKKLHLEHLERNFRISKQQTISSESRSNKPYLHNLGSIQRVQNTIPSPPLQTRGLTLLFILENLTTK